MQIYLFLRIKMEKQREYMYVWAELFLKCTSCGKWKTADSYRRWKNYKFWLASRCKDCQWEFHRERYQKNRDEISAQHKQYYWSNKEKISEHKSEYYRNNTEQIKEKNMEITKNLWFNRHTFHVKTEKYVKQNWLKPEACSICWATGTIDIHHPSYSSYTDWSKVVFCCRSCHKRIHSWDIECPEPQNLLLLNK